MTLGRSVGWMVVLAALWALGGCVSYFTDRYLDDRCQNTRIECRGRDSGEAGASKVDRKAWELDKKIGSSILDAASGEPEEPNVRPEYEDPSEINCKDGQVKICSAKEGCRCD